MNKSLNRRSCTSFFNRRAEGFPLDVNHGAHETEYIRAASTLLRLGVRASLRPSKWDVGKSSEIAVMLFRRMRSTRSSFSQRNPASQRPGNGFHCCSDSDCGKCQLFGSSCSEVRLSFLLLYPKSRMKRMGAVTLSDLSISIFMLVVCAGLKVIFIEFRSLFRTMRFSKRTCEHAELYLDLYLALRWETLLFLLHP